MSDTPAAVIASRLRLVRANMAEVLQSFDTTTPPDRATIQVRIARWVQAIDSIVGEADARPAAPSAVRDLMAAALSGADVVAAATTFDLHELTQLAAVLRPHATLTIDEAHVLTPIERASIATAAHGVVRFA